MAVVEFDLLDLLFYLGMILQYHDVTRHERPVEFFRYLHRLFTERRDSDLADILLKDRWMLIDVVLWVIAVIVILLVENRGFPV